MDYSRSYSKSKPWHCVLLGFKAIQCQELPRRQPPFNPRAETLTPDGFWEPLALRRVWFLVDTILVRVEYVCKAFGLRACQNFRSWWSVHWLYFGDFHGLGTWQFKYFTLVKFWFPWLGCLVAELLLGSRADHVIASVQFKNWHRQEFIPWCMVVYWFGTQQQKSSFASPLAQWALAYENVDFWIQWFHDCVFCIFFTAHKWFAFVWLKIWCFRIDWSTDHRETTSCLG